MKRLILPLLILVSLPVEAQLSWMKLNRGNLTGYTDEALALALDKVGNVITTGYVNNSGTLQDIFTIKRAPNGDSIWAQTYSTPGGGYDLPRSLAVDDSNCVIIGGEVGGQFGVLKYGPDGTFRWARKITSADAAYYAGVDSARNIFAAGTVSSAGGDILVAKLNPQGDTLWTYKYNGTGGDDRPNGMFVDRSGNCYVTGESPGGATNMDAVVIKILANGTLGWAQRYNGPGNGRDCGYGVVVDNAGNVYAAGESYVLNKGLDACVLSYTSGGSLRYARTFNGSYNYDDSFAAIAIDGSQNLFLAGLQGLAGGSFLFYTVKMLPNALGDTVWTRAHSIPGTGYGRAHAAVTDASGKVYISGECWTSSGNMGALCYNATGSLLWSAYYNGPGDDSEVGHSIVTNGRGTSYVAGMSVEVATYLDFALFAFQDPGTAVGAEDTEPGAFSLAQNFPNPFNPTTIVRYQVPVATDARLVVYDLLGREVAVLVDEPKAPGRYEVRFDGTGLASGVYFYTLTGGGYVESKKLVLMK
jgi:hypothetical protein